MPPPPSARAKLPALMVHSASATAPALKERPPQRKPPQLPSSNAAALAALRAGDRKPLTDPSRKESQDKVGNGAVAASLARGPDADPKFAVLKKDIAQKKRTVARSHPPANKEATSAQDASVPPKDDEVAQGKTANVEKMNDAKPKDFDKEAFIKAVEKAIAEKAPKNLEQADEFSDSGKPAEVKAEVAGKVGEGKTDSAEQIADTTAAPPDTSAAEVKQVVPLTPDRPPGTPATPDPAKATPDKLPPSATDMSAGPANVDREMTDNQVTEQQLKKSNEPEFGSALKDKNSAEQHSEATPPELRKNESQQLRQTTAQAKHFGATAMGAIAGQRARTGQQVVGGKKTTKSSDEEKRAQVTAILQKVFDTMKTDVEGILTGLDKLVDDQFTKGEKEARDAFTAEHRQKMDEYKDRRYNGGWGLVKWGHDKLFGLPEEANQIFVEARDNYVKRMRGVISDVADTIGRELTRAKKRIATGREELRKTVESLPKDLKALGKEAAAGFADKFDELTQSVDDKSTELVDTLATKYTDAVKSVDAEIAAEKEKNRGLVDKALDAVKGVIKTILELKDMLLGVLAKAAQAVMGILKDPIGFLGNLVSAVGGGLKQFKNNAKAHLEQGVLSWLLGTAATAGIELPTSFDIVSILLMIASLLGLSWANLRARIARKVPKEAMAAIEAGEHALPIVLEVRKRGIRALWDDLRDRVGDLKKTLIDNLVSYLLPTIIMAGITWIISLFNPASAFIRACKMIIDIIKFIVTNGRQIIEFVNTVLDAVIAIAKGGAGGVAGLVEKALARSIPVLIGALAALLGIGGIAGKVKEIFQKLARPVNKAIDWVIGKIVGLAKKVWAKVKALAKKLKAAGKKVKDKFTKKKPKELKKPGERRDDDKEAQAEKRLKRAVLAIEPPARKLLTKGASTVRLRVQLTLWRLRYRLSALTADPGGQILARINPSMPIPGLTHKRITPAELSTLLSPIFMEAEQKYERTIAITHAQTQPDPYSAGRQGWATGHTRSLAGLSSFEQAQIMRTTPPAGRFQWATDDVAIFTSTLPPDWQPGQIGKVNWIGKYTSTMADEIYRKGASVGLSQASLNQALSTGSPADIKNLRGLMTGGTDKEKDKFISFMRRLNFLVHTIEPGRHPSIATTTAISTTMLGTGHTELRDVLFGRLAPMAPVGAQAKGTPTTRELPPGTVSTRYTTDQALAERLRHRRVGAIIMDLLNTATKPNVVVSGSGFDLHPLADAIRGWLKARLDQHRTPEQLAAASAMLRAELVAFLASYYERSR